MSFPNIPIDFIKRDENEKKTSSWEGVTLPRHFLNDGACPPCLRQAGNFNGGTPDPDW
jgi:hypothetical protein